MQDISGFGLRLVVKASSTFPAGFPVTQFADDADPFDLPSIQIRDKAMGLNGDLTVWGKATPTEITISVIPGSNDDKNLAILFDANRVSRGKRPARDKVTIVAVYPDGSTVTATPGVMTDGPPGKSVASAGRMKSHAYKFTFEAITRA